MAILATEPASQFAFQDQAFVTRKCADLGLSPSSNYYAERVTKIPGGPVFFNLRPISDQVFTPTDQSAAVAAAMASPTGSLSLSNQLVSRNRPPGINDNTSAGYSSASPIAWQYAGDIWLPTGTFDATCAAWAKQPAYGGLPVDIMGAANVPFSGGLVARKSGYTGASIDVVYNIATVAQAAVTINILANGELDNVALQKIFGIADSGSVVCVKLYDQSGAGNHAVKDASYPGLYVDWDSVLQRYCLNGDTYGTTPTRCLRIPGTASTGFFITAGNNMGAMVLGRPIKCGGVSGYNAPFSIGDAGTAPNHALSINAYKNGRAHLFLSGQADIFMSSGGSSSPNGGGTTTALLDSGPACVIMGVSTRYEVWYNEQYAYSGAPLNQGYASGWIGTDSPTAGHSGMMRIVALDIFNVAPTAAQAKALRYAAYVQLDIRPQERNSIFVLGDSRLDGKGLGRSQTPALMLSERLNRQWRVYNMGVDGTTIAAVSDATFGAIATVQTNTVPNARNEVLIQYDVNEFIVSAATPEQALASIQSAVALVKASANNPVVTLMYGSSTLTTTNGANTKMPLLRALITAQGTVGMGCDRLLDLGIYAPFSAAGNAAYYPDGLHWSEGLMRIAMSAYANLLGYQ